MGIAFTEIPSTNFSPGAFIEKGFGGGASNLPRAALIIGYTHGATPGPLLEPKLIAGSAHEWPRDSQIADQIAAFRRVNPYAELWAVAIDDPSAGTAASRVVTVTGAATEDGTFRVYVGDQWVDVAVASGDTAADVAAAIEAAVDTLADAPAAAVAAAAAVTFTAKMTGVESNWITIAFSPKQGQEIPDGLGGLTRANLAGGLGTGDLTTALATVMEKRFFAVISGLTDAQSVTDLVEEMARRWTATVELDGQGFIGVAGAVAAQAALGVTYNAEEITAKGAGLSLSPPWKVAAAAAARDIQKSDPILGWLGMRLTGIDAPETDYTRGERETLLKAGISTFRVEGGGMVIDRLVTTRTKDADDATDYSLLPLTKRRLLEFLGFNWRSRVYNKYIARGYKLATDPNLIPTQGSRIITPVTLMAEAVAWFEAMMNLGLVQDLAGFKEALIAEQNGTDETRLDAFLAPTGLDELVTLATKMELR